MTEGLTIEFTNTAATRRRYRFEPRSAGGWLRTEEEYREGRWRPVGREVVADVVIEASGTVEGDAGV